MEKHFYLLAAVLFAGILFACSDDDDSSTKTSTNTTTTTQSNAASTLTLALEEDTGAADMVTTNADIVISGNTTGATLSFVVMTNAPGATAATHTPSPAVTAVGTNDFGLDSPTGTLEVSIRGTLTKDSKTVTTNLDYTLIVWPDSVTVEYDDTGADDGVTTESELTVAGLDDFDGTNVKLVSYVITNTDTMMTNDAVTVDEALSATYTVDLREVKPTLDDDEKIHSVTFDYKGHEVEHEFDPAVDYDHDGAIWKTNFSVETAPTNMAINSGGILMIVYSTDATIRFYNTDGTDGSITIDGTAESNFSTDLALPKDIAVDSSGKVYVANTAVTGFGIKIYSATFGDSNEIAISNYRVHVHGTHLYAKVKNTDGTTNIKTYAVADRAEGSSLASANIETLAIDGNGVLHVLNNDDDRLEAWTGTPSTTFSAESGHTYAMRPPADSADADSSEPFDVVIGPMTGRIYVSDTQRNQVLIFTYDADASTNQYTLVGTLGRTDMMGGSGDSEFSAPGGMVIHEGHLYILDMSNSRVQVFEVPE